MGGIRRTSICEEGNKESPQRIDSIEVLLEKKRPHEEEEIRHIKKENHCFERENKIFREIL